MEISINTEVLEGALGTLKNFVHKPGADAIPTLTATHITADEKAGTITFVGNNSSSQRIQFAVKAKVVKDGEVLVSVSDLLTATSTIVNKSQDVKLRLDKDGLAIFGPSVSVNIPVFSLDAKTPLPIAPKKAKGDGYVITVNTEGVPRAFARATPSLVDSPFNKMMTWIADNQLCFMSISKISATFASVEAKDVSEDSPVILWNVDNLKRIIGLLGGSKSLSIAHDTNKDGELRAEFVCTVVAEDGTEFVVEQSSEQANEKYNQARDVLLNKVGAILDQDATVIKAKTSEVSRSMGSAERVRSIGRDEASAKSTRLSISDSLIELSLPDGSFAEEIAAEVEGDNPRDVTIHAPLAGPIVDSLGSETKVTLRLPVGTDPQKGGSVLTMTDNSELTTKGSALPVTGYWGIFTMKEQER